MALWPIQICWVVFSAVFEAGVSRRTSVRGVRPAEQVAHRLSSEQCEPASALVLGSIVEHVAALAKRCQVLVGVVAWIVVSVGGRQHHSGRAHASEEIRLPQASAEAPSLAITPAAALGIPPAAITEVEDPLQVRAVARLATPSCAVEADHVGELRPVNWVEVAMLPPDRHPRSTM